MEKQIQNEFNNFIKNEEIEPYLKRCLLGKALILPLNTKPDLDRFNRECAQIRSLRAFIKAIEFFFNIEIQNHDYISIEIDKNIQYIDKDIFILYLLNSIQSTNNNPWVKPSINRYKEGIRRKAIDHRRQIES